MNNEINNFLLSIECTLLNETTPDYIEISYQNGFIHILTCKSEYQYFTISERIKSIFILLEYYHSDIIEMYPVIVECFDEKEITELFKLYGKTV